MNYKLQRNIWIASGLIFLLVFIFYLFDGKALNLSSLLSLTVSMAALLNAYLNHKKLSSGSK
ncbi:MAG: hypothetical protein Q8936_15540 [Bacillota bacterium]|nr:hypothetical protein [Bacillota bacterium]